METENTDSTIKFPELNIFSGGDWASYQEGLYEIFINTLTKGDLNFLGLNVHSPRRPEYKDKHFTFWHLISEGEVEEDRTPDLRRCERLHWIRWVVENAGSHPGISFWENKRWGSSHTVIWYEEGEYAVVLAKRNGYFVLKSAYVVLERRAKGFRAERDEYRKLNRS